MDKDFEYGRPDTSKMRSLQMRRHSLRRLHKADINPNDIKTYTKTPKSDCKQEPKRNTAKVAHRHRLKSNEADHPPENPKRPPKHNYSPLCIITSGEIDPNPSI